MWQLKLPAAPPAVTCSGGAGDGTEAFQRDATSGAELVHAPLIDPLHQQLLIEQRVVRSERARHVTVTLVVVAQVGVTQ